MKNDALTIVKDIKRAMGSFATGVVVVTTRFEGQDYGMTCNSFNTVSMDPPMVLWSIRQASFSHPAFTRSDGYSVSILSEGQKHLAMTFARGSQRDRFETAPIERLASGRAIISHASAWFDCALDRVVPAGDHDILLGSVLDFGSSDRQGLAYFRNTFLSVTAPRMTA